MTARDGQSLPAPAEKVLLFLAAQAWAGPVQFLPSAVAGALSIATRQVVDHYITLLEEGFVSEAPTNALAVVDQPGVEYIRAMAAREFPEDAPSVPLRVVAERLLALPELPAPEQ